MIYCNEFINVVVPVILHRFLLIPSSYSAIILADELPALCLLYNNINHLNKGLWASVQTLFSQLLKWHHHLNKHEPYTQGPF